MKKLEASYWCDEKSGEDPKDRVQPSTLGKRGSHVTLLYEYIHESLLHTHLPTQKCTHIYM